MIDLSQVHFTYGKDIVLNNINITLEDAKCTVLMGQNGIGKSTLMAIAAGAIDCQKGIVTRTGEVGYVPQSSSLFEDLSVKDNLRFFSALKGVPLPKQVIFPVNEIWHKKFSKLSGGMKKRVNLLCGTVGNPQNILLDEPCASLDIEGQEILMEQIRIWKSRGHCILYIAHDLEEAKSIADEVILLKENELVHLDYFDEPYIRQLLHRQYDLT